MRKIFLPELISINIKNYSLYPNGLDYTFDFIKGFNLILGGNGMGKTTFVSIIKYALIGNYKKQFEYTRTYKEVKIEKRERNSDDFFKNRIDNSIVLDSDPTVTLSFRVSDTVFTVTRNLKEIKIESLFINGVQIDGEIILESKYEAAKNKGLQIDHFLSSIYEAEFEKEASISFDDLIFFVNYILFFGEDHKTILWDEYVQKELFNTIFNSPELNIARQEAEREAKYFDSRSRHKSEDKRAIRRVLDKVERKGNNSEFSLANIISLKEKIEKLNLETIYTHNQRKENDTKASIIENEKNTLAQTIDEIESRKNSLINKLSFIEYKNQHRLYNSFLKNVQTNHICPLCNSQSESLYLKTVTNQDKCWVCDSQLINSSELNSESKEKLDSINNEYNIATNKLKNLQSEIRDLENANYDLDNKFRTLESEKRQTQLILRELEFENSQDKNPSELKEFYDEIEKLSVEQEEFSAKSEERRIEANRIAKLIEDTVLNNVQNFSNQFSLYAQKFLGVTCKLTYEKFDNDELKKFYPIINSTIRRSENELSESQRFFIDHAFRMSILSHFYTTPTFYIIETPDSSLDISYEKNAADVFSSFLDKPYSLILTSNLNNSSFVNYIMENKDKEKAIVPLFEIAKKSQIQINNEVLNNLYNTIKNG
ncbi:AAA family ATPase [Sphingobacterium multivorum]|uniref:AAA family ATPase n=1 Tax=Sphingobacterium multivorum TaxID=28454 RepID=UPI0028A67E50|nr:AAA family ATPase [Sphingobacterium multivorum]